MPYCITCGHQNVDTARFCNACGQPMPTANPPPPQQSQAPLPRTPQPTPPRSPNPPPPRSGNVRGQTRVFQPVQQQPQQPGGSGMGIAGMVLGIIAVVFAFIPLVGLFIAIPCIAVGLPLSVIGFVRNRRRNQSRGMATAGIACNSVALLLTIISIAITAAAVNELDEALSESTGTRSSSGSQTVRSTGASTSGVAASASAPVMPTATPAPAYFSGRSNSYAVGVDIEPGTYRTAGPLEWGAPCNFSRLRTAGASATDTDEVLESQQVSGWGTVTILESDGEFFTQNCHEWTPVQQSVVAASTSAPSATETAPSAATEDTPTPTPERLPLGQHNPPTAEEIARVDEERRRLALVFATPTPAPIIQMESGSRERERKPPTNRFTDGYWAVGTDIFPGEYQTLGPPVGRRTESPCTFVRLRSADGKVNDPEQVIEVVDIWLPPTSTTVTIEATDGAVYSSNCREWSMQGSLEPSHQATIAAHHATVPSPFGGGDFERDAYHVGREIAQGWYRTEGPKNPALGQCIFALMKKGGADPFINQRDADEVIEIYGTDEPVDIVIAGRDVRGFYTRNCQEWTPLE